MVLLPILEESKDDTKSMFSNSEDNDIESMLEGLSDYEDGLFDSDYKKYITSVSENKRR